MSEEHRNNHYQLYVLVSLQAALVAGCTHWAVLNMLSLLGRLI